MESKKNCRFCSKEIDSKRQSKIFCNMECYKNFMMKPKEKIVEASQPSHKVKARQPKQEVITINKGDPGWLEKFFSFLIGKQ